MTEENVNQEEEVLDTKPIPETESEEASEDIESLFDDSSDDSKKTEDDKIARLEKQVSDLQKGIAKAFSDKGRQKDSEVKKTETPSVIKNLYFKANPEAQVFWDEVEREAKLLGKDPFELYENSTFLRGEAKARYEAKNEEEKNKSKIAKPSNQTGSSQVDISKVKPEEVEKLPAKEKIAWLKAQAEKERNSID